MLDKLLYNNLVVSSKKTISQGRVQTINKEVRKIRQLKASLDQTPDNKKNEKKLQKHLEIVAHIKTLTHRDIVTNTLTLSNEPSKILTNGLLSTEEMGHALLAKNKMIADVVKNIKEVLDLDDLNKLQWADELKETTKRRTKRNRTEKKKKERLDRKARNTSRQNNAPTEDSFKKEDTQSNNLQVTNKKVIPDFSAAKRKKNDETLSQQNLRQIEKHANDVVEDPFFSLSNGAKYLSPVISSNANSCDKKPRKLINKQSNNPSIDCIINNAINLKEKQKKKNSNVINMQHKSAKIESTPHEMNLHPSWIAKQKLKPSIVDFKGKKITFD